MELKRKFLKAVSIFTKGSDDPELILNYIRLTQHSGVITLQASDGNIAINLKLEANNYSEDDDDEVLIHVNRSIWIQMVENWNEEFLKGTNKNPKEQIFRIFSEGNGYVVKTNNYSFEGHSPKKEFPNLSLLFSDAEEGTEGCYSENGYNLNMDYMYKICKSLREMGLNQSEFHFPSKETQTNKMVLLCPNTEARENLLELKIMLPIKPESE